MASIPQGYFVYALCDPETGDVAYIGQTTLLLAHRLRGHLYSAKHAPNAPISTRVGWIGSVLQRGLVPTIRLLESVATSAELDTQERYWIAFYRAQGAPLVNGNAGGTGLTPGSAAARRVGDKTGKVYIGFLDPSGEPLTIENMKRFCDAHGLVRKAMLDVYHGRKRHHHGYGHERTAGQVPQNVKLWTGFIRPDGTREPPFWNLQLFCRQQHLSCTRMHGLVTGSYPTYKGWRYEELHE